MGVILPEDQLKEMIAMVRENNRMLKDMRRSAFIGGILHFIWVVLFFVVIPYISWLFIQPYLTAFTNTFSETQAQSQQAGDALQKLQELGNNFDLQGILSQFGGGSTTPGQ